MKYIGIYTRITKAGVKQITIRECGNQFVEVSTNMAKIAGHKEFKATMHETFKEARGALMKDHGMAWFNMGRKMITDLEKGKLEVDTKVVEPA